MLPLHRDILFNAHADPNVALKYFPDGKFPEPICTSPLRYANVPPNRINRRGISGKVVAQIAEWVEKAKKGEPGEVVPCSLVHPWESSHLWSPIDRFVEVTRWIL